MSWLNIGALPWLLLVPVLVALYMLRPRAETRQVPTVRFWKMLPQVDRPRARLRRPPLSLLLLLQLILLAAGAFALMRPSFAEPAGRSTVILLDASGSMQTSASGAQRFSEARDEALKIAAGMQSQDRATLLLMGTSAGALCSACTQSDLQAAINKTHPGAGRADWDAALGVARGLAGRAGVDHSETYAISDGAFEPLAAVALPPNFHYVQVSAPTSSNSAITSLKARRPPNGNPGYTAFARVDNLGTAPSLLDVSALADTVPLSTQQVELPAGGHADLTWQVPAGTARLTVSLTPPDVLPADDSAVLFLPAEGQYKVALNVDQPNLFSRALAGIPGIAPVDTRQGTSPDAPAFSVIQGKLPDTLPPGNLLLINPDGSLVPSSGDLPALGPLTTQVDHPLLAGIDLRALLVDRAKRIDTPVWLEPLAGTDEGPLLLAGELEGRRIAVLTFDIADSNLAKLAAFPLFMANVTDWLSPLAGAQALLPGESVALSPGATVTAPDKTAQRVGSTGLYAETEQAGIYTVSQDSRAQDGTPDANSAAGTNTFAVNMTDIKESNLLPRAHPEFQNQVETPSAQANPLNHEYWSSLAAAALLLVGAEWLFYCIRRGRS